ncbi:MAG: YfhO family protein, partial [Clostridia bacterium]|nr:YfhO family protein [Clostridia bacterium]
MVSPLKKERELGLVTFGITLGMASLLFLPFIIYDRGYFIYYGDFNAQQIPFYQLAHDAVRSGNIGWSWGTDLGANFIGSYSFYLLGSPFFWLTLPFPNDWLPYMMAPLLALKIGGAGWTAYAYTRRFLQPRTAMIAGILYAFSGFSLYNIFFNHFHEATLWFPLMLLGVEQYMKDGKRGLFALAVLLSALSNYYFFIGQAIFIMIYWVLRAASGDWEKCTRRFFGLWLEALLGTAAAAVILLPSFLTVIQNSRTDTPVEGWGLLIYGNSQRLYDILHCFFFPPELPARANFLPDANNKWSSMTAWIPVFGCTGAIAYFQSRKHTDWLRRLLTVLFFCATIPALNAMFQLFNAAYYARWYYMLTLMLVLATLRCFEQEERYPVNWSRALGWSGGITAVFTVLIGLVPKKWEPDAETGKWEIGLEKYPARFWLYVGIAVIGLVLTLLLVRQFREDKRRFMAWCTAMCVGVSLLFGW